jgi:hypothetical protein
MISLRAKLTNSGSIIFTQAQNPGKNAGFNAFRDRN